MTARPRPGYHQVAEIFHAEPLTMSVAVMPDKTTLVTHGRNENLNCERLLHLVDALMQGYYQ